MAFLANQWLFWLVMLSLNIVGLVVLHTFQTTLHACDQPIKDFGDLVWRRVYNIFRSHYKVLLLWMVLGEFGLFLKFPWADELLWTLYALSFE